MVGNTKQRCVMHSNVLKDQILQNVNVIYICSELPLFNWHESLKLILQFSYGHAGIDFRILHLKQIAEISKTKSTCST